MSYLPKPFGMRRLRTELEGYPGLREQLAAATS